MTFRLPLAIAALTATLPLAGCATTQQVASDDGSAGMGEPTRAGPLIIRPLKVVEDSRCPINARCVWAGRLIVRASISHHRNRETHELTLGEPIAVAGGRLVLDGAEPGRMVGQEQTPRAYRLHFTFSN